MSAILQAAPALAASAKVRRYRGFWQAQRTVVLCVSPDEVPLPLRRDLRDYAEAYSWGREGHPYGCAQLALALLADALVDDAAAVELHLAFQHRFVMSLHTSRAWSTTAPAIRALAPTLEWRKTRNG